MADRSSAPAFTVSEEQCEFRSAVRSFMERYCPEAEVRRVAGTPDAHDPRMWRAMADQLHLQGLIIPDEYGGEGFGFTELFLVLEETGSALLPGPYFSSAVLAATVLLQCADDTAKKQYLPGIATGHTVATLALTERPGSWQPDRFETTAIHSSGTWALRGVKHYVPDGVLADLVLVIAQTDDGIGLFAVDDTALLRRRGQSTLDPTRRQSVITFADTPARRLDTEPAADSLARALALSAAALAAEQVGGAQRCLDQAVGYAKVRQQFGRPIGSFQAIRHTCADLLLDIECARGAAQYAATAADVYPEQLPAAASLAKAYCSDAFARAAAANIQLHGGIGFTWEHPAHLYFKRAQSSAMLLGDADHHRRLLADRIGL
ncbi:acyl-CoA dehydrogenase family protein [Mycolicibacterium sp. 050232]|uniref:acyl-CoA dehydrogenase family protein n=1 Tax=Mycolicibacterium sp. 050232 TaxID=3113982 RepID=UPI002E2D98BD|nr:acyl-CoA dehydrogenase family protein [Mycolicibacterium sp. 050232]MED5810887.1 acyl-CoA dehydrogenase family protein [Mycolicibacterium sp. 050232]